MQVAPSLLIALKNVGEFPHYVGRVNQLFYFNNFDESTVL